MSKARELASRLQAAADALVAVIVPIDDDHWHRIPDPGTWSIGKEAEHVAEAAGTTSGSSGSPSARTCRPAVQCSNAGR